MAKVNTLVDNFATSDAAKWSLVSPAVITNSEVQIAGQASAITTYGQVISQDTYDITESSVFVEVSEVLLGGTTSETILILRDMTSGSIDYNSSYEILYANQASPIIIFRDRAAGANNNVNLAYDSTTMRFWRIRETGGNVYWDTSPDGITWTQRRGPRPTRFTNAKVEMRAGHYGAGDATGTARFDNLNILPPESFSDTFDRADSTTTLGLDWTVGQGTWGIRSGRAYSVSEIDGDHATVEINSADMDVSAKTYGHGTAAFPDIIARYIDPNNFFKFGYQEPSLVLYRRVAGTWTELGSVPYTPTAGDKYTISCVGTRIVAKLNDIPVITVADSSFSTATSAGMRKGASGAGIEFDDFAVTEPARDLIQTDSFDRADSTTTLGSTEQNRAWVATGTSVWGITGNQAYMVSGGWGSAVDLGHTTTDDIYVQAEVTYGTSPGAPGVNLLSSADGTTVIGVQMTSATMRMFRKQGGTYDFYGPGDVTLATPFASGQTYLVRLQVVDNIVSMYLDGVLIGTPYTMPAGDITTYRTATATYAGIHEDSNGVGTRFNNFRAATFPPRALPTTGTEIASHTFSTADGSAWPTAWAFKTPANYSVQKNAGRVISTGNYADDRAVDTTSTHSDAEILLRARFRNYQAAEHYIAINFRADNNTAGGTASAATNHYSLEFDNGNAWFYRTVNGASTNLGSGGNKFISATEWRWVRIRAVGSDIKAKVWPDNVDEPAAWGIEVTDSTHTSGVLRLQVSAPSAVAPEVLFDDITVTDLTPLEPPTSLAAIGDADSINLSWSAPASGPTPTSYNVRRHVGAPTRAAVGTLLANWVASDLDTQATGSAVTSWSDRVENAEFAQATATAQPSLQKSVLNGRSIVRFDGSDVLSVTGRTQQSQPLTVVLVHRATSATVQQQYMQLGQIELIQQANGARRIYAGLGLDSTSDPYVGNTWEILVFHVNGASSTISADGAQIGAGDTGAGHTGTAWYLGQSSISTRPYTGDVAEVLVYSGTWSAAQRADIDYVLQNEYGITTADSGDALTLDTTFSVTAPTTTYDDTTAVSGTTYIYTARSVVSGTESADSNSATAAISLSSVPVGSGYLKTNLAGTWTLKPVKWHDGATWLIKPMKRYANGVWANVHDTSAASTTLLYPGATTYPGASTYTKASVNENPYPDANLFPDENVYPAEEPVMVGFETGSFEAADFE